MNKNSSDMSTKYRGWCWDAASTSADSTKTLEDPTTPHRPEDKAEIPAELIEIKLYARARVNLLYKKRNAFDDILKKGELVNLQALRNLLNTRITQYERRALEMCILMLSLVQQRLTQEHVDDIFDVSSEVCSVTTKEEMQYATLREPFVSMLVLSSIWTIEAAGSTNVAHLAYDLLFNIGLACTNEHWQRYVEHFLGKDTKFDGNEVYWFLRLIQVSIMRKQLNINDTARLARICIKIANCKENTIYVNDILADLLVSIWHYHPCDPCVLPPLCRYRYLAKLLVAGVVNEQILSMLLTAAVSGPYTIRKLALSALVRAHKSNTTKALWRTMNKEFLVQGSADLSILSATASMIGDRDSAILYLKHLYDELTTIFDMGKMTLDQMKNKVELGISHLVTIKLGTTTEIKRHIRSAGEEYFAIRDILQAITATYQTMKRLGKQRPPQTGHGLPNIDIATELIFIALYIGTIREEFMPHLATVIEGTVMQAETLMMSPVRFCLRMLERDGATGIFFDQFITVTCKLLITIIKRWATTHENMTLKERNEVNLSALDMVRSTSTVLSRYGPFLMRYKSSVHIASMLASIAVYVGVVPWDAVTCSLHKQVSRVMVHVLKRHLLARRGRCHGPEQQCNIGDVIHNYREGVLNFIVAGFEMLCNTMAPPVKLIEMVLTLVWQPKHATHVFNGMQALMKDHRIGRGLVSALITYCLHANVHTDWGEETIVSLQKFTKLLLKHRKRNNARKMNVKDSIHVRYTPGYEWKARRSCKFQHQGRVKLNGGNHIAIFLNELTIRLKVEVETLSVAIARPVNLLDEHLCVPRALMETKIHDCPGE